MSRLMGNFSASSSIQEMRVKIRWRLDTLAKPNSIIDEDVATYLG